MDKNKLIKVLLIILIILEAANLIYVYITEERIAWFSFVLLVIIVICFFGYINRIRKNDDEEMD